MRTEATVKLTCQTCSHSIGICIDLDACSGIDSASLISRKLEAQVIQEARAQGWHEIKLTNPAGVDRLAGKLCVECTSRVLRALGMQPCAGNGAAEDAESAEKQE